MRDGATASLQLNKPQAHALRGETTHVSACAEAEQAGGRGKCVWFSHCRAKTSRCSDREASQEPTDSTRHIGSAREQLGSERGLLPARNRQGSSAGKQKKVLQAPSCPHADLQRVPAKAAPVCSALPACCAERQSAPHTAPPAGGSSPAGCLAYFLGQYCTVEPMRHHTRKARLQALGSKRWARSKSLSLHNYIRHYRRHIP